MGGRDPPLITMTRVPLKALLQEEKRLFDTYRHRRSNIEKAEHLEKMAAVIRKIDKIESDEAYTNLQAKTTSRHVRRSQKRKKITKARRL